MHLRKFAAIASATLALTLLSGCTTAQPTPAPTTAKPSASCFPGTPKVKGEIKAGGVLTVTGPGSDGCFVKLTDAKKQVSLVMVDTRKQVLASTLVKATATGKYTAKLQVPSTYKGKATVRLDSGFRFKCAGTGSCAALSTTLNVTPIH